jgi:membrane associated rhomboid family serine protease
MIIPIGHEHETVRRLPWVCIVILALNTLVFLFVGLPGLNREELVRHKAVEVLEYWQQNPFLDLPEEFVRDVLPPGQWEQLKVATEAFKNMHPAAAEGDHALEERKLRTLVQGYFAAKADSPFLSWGLVPAHPTLSAILKSMFMHAGWFHFLGNMFLFYLAGLIVEDAFGRPLFAGLYLASGIVAALAHVVMFPDSTIPLVGASGAIAGVMGAFLIRFARSKLRFAYFFWVIVIIRGTFTAPAWLMLPLWLLEQLFYASMVKSGGGVAYWAHVGGFVFGAAVAYAVRALRIEERYVHPVIEAKISLTQDPALEAGLARLAVGDGQGAREALAPLLAREPRHADANLAIWESYLRDETPERGVSHLVHVIEHELKQGDLALARDHWREMVHHGGQIGPPPLAFRLASALQEDSPVDAVEVLLRIADDPAAGLLAAKAAHRLEALATTPEDRAYWHKRVSDATPAPAAAAPHSAGPLPAAVATTPARPSASGQTRPVPAAAVTPPGPAPAAPTAAPFVVEACYLESMDNDGILLRAGGGASEFLPFGRIAAVAVGGITGAAKPFLVIDLVLRPSAGVHTVLRLLSSQLDPRMLTGRGDLSPVEAFRELVRRIAVAASAPMLPGGKTSGVPTLATFRSLEEYEARVLHVALGG